MPHQSLMDNPARGCISKFLHAAPFLPRPSRDAAVARHPIGSSAPSIAGQVPVAPALHPLQVKGDMGMWTRLDGADDPMRTGRAAMTRPPEAPDSLTPPPEWGRPIDPDVADRWRYAAGTDAAVRPLRVTGALRAAPRPRDAETPRRVNVFSSRRPVGSRRATRHSAALARARCGHAAGGRRPSRPAA
jgi:hypothetical protein